MTAVHNWIYEIGAAAGETVHRDNIFSNDFTFMGAGQAAGGTQYTNYWTQDFIGNPVTRPPLTDGIHFPKTAASGKPITFGATWYDKSGQAPAAISVVVDGHCHALTLLRGGAGLAAYESALSFADGCHPYYFLATASGGKISSYPDDGSLQVGLRLGRRELRAVRVEPGALRLRRRRHRHALAHTGARAGRRHLRRVHGPSRRRLVGAGGYGAVRPADHRQDECAGGNSPPPAMRGSSGCAFSGGARSDSWLLVPLLLCALAGLRRRRA